MQQVNLKEIKLKLPKNIAESLTKNEIISLLLDKAFNKMEESGLFSYINVLKLVDKERVRLLLLKIEIKNRQKDL